jgi:hypothetical protein
MTDKIITMLEIPTDGPWDTIFYMCGMCLDAVKLRDVEEHARDHGVDGVKLYSKELVVEAIKDELEKTDKPEKKDAS